MGGKGDEKGVKEGGRRMTWEDRSEIMIIVIAVGVQSHAFSGSLTGYGIAFKDAVLVSCITPQRN